MGEFVYVLEREEATPLHQLQPTNVYNYLAPTITTSHPRSAGTEGTCTKLELQVPNKVIYTLRS